MRVAFLSDIHGNVPALEAVIEDARAHGASHVICLGDTVGYGPQPAEALDALRAVASAVVLGNHDAAACGLLNPALFNPFARETAERASLALSPEAKAWLRGLPYVLEGDGFACVHASFDAPESFRYVETKEDAALSLDAAPGFSLLVVGHTHIPCAFLRETPQSPVRKLPPAPEGLLLKPGARVVLNPGAVGFPRGDTLTADYALYDTVTRRILFRAVAYDLAPYRLAVVRNGYNILNYWFLSPSARRRQTEQAFLNPTRAAGAPVGQDAPFHPRRPRKGLGLPRGFWPLVTLFLCLGLGSCVALWASDPEPAAVVLSGESVLPPLSEWTHGGPDHLFGTPSFAADALTVTPQGGPARGSLLSPLCLLPSGAERLRLSFRVEAPEAKPQGLAYRARVLFFLADGSQRLDEWHRYKRPGFQGYTLRVPPDATHLRVAFDFEAPVPITLFRPTLRVF